MQIAPEHADDRRHISEVITAAFKGHPLSAGTEAQIVDLLRRNGSLSVSLVAKRGEHVVGHVAFSPVRINGQDYQWYGLGPLAVAPDQQCRGFGSALVSHGLAELRRIGAAGCVVLGDPKYYSRFGFQADPGLLYPGPPPSHFMALILHGATPRGAVAYDAAFSEA